MRTDDKNSVPRVRITILGSPNVGKSALTVRYLTRRYIGEYRSNIDLLYRQTISFENSLLDVEIVDISTENHDSFPMEQIQWADACMIVYSITDRSSFEYVARILAQLRIMHNPPVTYLIGNKADLDHYRKISEREGYLLATSFGIGFSEISVAENSPELYKSFDKLLENFRNLRQRKFSVSKMFGTLIGNSNIINNHKQQQQQLKISPGTVRPCQKGELHKSRLLRRRKGFKATASV